MHHAFVGRRHWLNALLLYVLFTSGLGIFNAHPRLYWGQYGANYDHAWLGLERFGSWITLPAHYDLAMSRHWHLSADPIFASALRFYMLWSLVGGHLGRDLALRRGELAPRHGRQVRTGESRGGKECGN